MHSRSTFLPQLFHTLLFAVLIAAAASGLRAQAIDAGAIFRVFLKTGSALPSYGESAVVGDRVVFTLIVGTAESRPAVQLMSLPADRVDLLRTRRYAEAMRAKHYAATRGETDYAAMTQEVQKTLAQIKTVTDAQKRLELAEDARKRLIAWSEGTYGYRAADVRELTGLFDEVITDLKAAAGIRQFSVDLRTGPPEAPPESIMSAPTVSEYVALAVEAARAADGEEDRMAILRAAAMTATPDLPSDVHEKLTREVEAEARATESYTALFTAVRAHADAARRRGDVAGVESAIAELKSGDRSLGGRRSHSVDAVTGELSAVLEATRTYRASLDRYALMRGTLLQYERTIRPVMSGLDGITPILNALRDFKYTAYERLERSNGRLAAFRSTLAAIKPPVDLADVHATLDSALKMADYACFRRRMALSLVSESIDREASSAAAGALMLATLAREQLIARLYPPKIK